MGRLGWIYRLDEVCVLALSAILAVDEDIRDVVSPLPWDAVIDLKSLLEDQLVSALFGGIFL